jgi:hypothetical protein
LTTASEPLHRRHNHSAAREAMPMLAMGGAGLFFIALGLSMYWHRARERAKAMATLDWSHAPGRVTASYIGNTTIPGAYEYGPPEAYEPQISYSYEVAGAAYQGVRISFANLIDTNKERVTDLLARYPLGAEVQVAYNPADPKESVLEQTLKGTSPINVEVIGMFVTGAAAIVLAFLLESHRD